MLTLNSRYYKVKTYSPRLKKWIISDLRSRGSVEIYASDFRFVDDSQEPSKVSEMNRDGKVRTL